ncbi:MAG: enoyl-CoA hydratase/isomerase family protein, partial [Rhizobacter sp.]|nr:enoyl-CoA hydratase/isomerase family protein [Rhizobacter sp.]
DLLPRIRRDPDVRVLVLEGAGGAFCAGGDVRGMDSAGPRSAAQVRAGMERYRRVTVELHGFDRPVIAAVDGVAYGAGFSLLLMADIVLLSDRARLCMVFQRIGLIPDLGAFYTLPRVVGLQRAKELIFSAREIDAAEALRIGIAMEVTTPDALMPRAAALARSFCGASATAMSLGKRALQMSMQSELATMLELEACGQALASSSEYAKESVRRFGAKEAPQFRWPAAGGGEAIRP